MATCETKQGMLKRFGYKIITHAEWSNGVYKLGVNIVYKLTIDRLENLLEGLSE